MKKFLALLLVATTALLVSSTVTIAKDKPASTTWTGTLIDKHCGAHAEADKLAAHEKACVMKCAKNGKDLGVSIDGTWYSFDKKGEKLGWSILKSATADANIQVKVNGTLKGNKIHVASMEKV
jgi:hypothetical protein